MNNYDSVWYVFFIFCGFFVDDGSMFEEVEKQEDILTIGLVGK